MVSTVKAGTFTPVITATLVNCPTVQVTQQFTVTVTDECSNASLILPQLTSTTINYIAASGQKVITFRQFASSVGLEFGNLKACGARAYKFVELNLPFAKIVPPPTGSEFTDDWKIAIDAALTQIGTYKATL